MLILIGVIFAILYLYSMMEDMATRRVSNKMNGLRLKYEDTVKEYNLAQLAKKYKNRSLKKWLQWYIQQLEFFCPLF